MIIEQDIDRTGEVEVFRILRIGRLLRGKYSRLIPQLLLGLIAFIMIYDGLTGPPLAARNTATVISWVVFRGLIILTALRWKSVLYGMPIRDHPIDCPQI